MRKFLIKVGNDQFEVEVEEIKNFGAETKPKVAAPKSVNYAAKTAPAAADVVSAQGSLTIDSPMPGNILRLNVQTGDVVKAGQPVFVLEAMKMENEITAPKNGKVVAIKANPGDTVCAGQAIIVLE